MKNIDNKRSYRQFVKKTSSAISKIQDVQGPAADELQVEGIFLGFPVSRTIDGNVRSVLVQDVPEKRFGKKKDGSGPTSFPLDLKTTVRIESLKLVDGVIKVHPEIPGAYLCKATVSFDGWTKAWLEANYKTWYNSNGQVQIEGYTSDTPLSEFIDKDGKVCTHKWVTIYHQHHIKVEMKDGDTCIYRARNEDGKPVVPERTFIILNKCGVKLFVRINDEKTEIKSYLSIKCGGGVRFPKDYDANIPLVERVRRQDNPDQHMFIDVRRLALEGDKALPIHRGMIPFESTYSSPKDTSEGITVLRIPPKDSMVDFVSTWNEKTKPRVIHRAYVFQWHDEPEDWTNTEVFSVKATDYGDKWTHYGITDLEHYGYIMSANPIWSLCEGSIWTGATLEQEANQNMINASLQEGNDESVPQPMQITDDGSGGGDDLMDLVKGYYTFSIDRIFPYYLKMLPVMGIAVSPEWVLDTFADFVGTQGRKENVRTTLTFTPLQAATFENPLHDICDPGRSPVVSLGNNLVQDPDADTLVPTCHAFNGDFYPYMKRVDFYVLTSHAFDIEDEEDNDVALLGERTDGDFSKSEALLKRLIEEEQVKWWLFAVDRKAAQYAKQEVIHTKKAPLPVPTNTTTATGVTIVATDEQKATEKEQEKEPEPEVVKQDQDIVVDDDNDSVSSSSENDDKVIETPKKKKQPLVKKTLQKTKTTKPKKTKKRAEKEEEEEEEEDHVGGDENDNEEEVDASSALKKRKKLVSLKKTKTPVKKDDDSDSE